MALALCARRVRATSKPPQILVAAVGSSRRRRLTQDPNELGPTGYYGVCVSHILRLRTETLLPERNFPPYHGLRTKTNSQTLATAEGENALLVKAAEEVNRREKEEEAVRMREAEERNRREKEEETARRREAEERARRLIEEGEDRRRGEEAARRREEEERRRTS